jgi:hypothetical protein
MIPAAIASKRPKVVASIRIASPIDVGKTETKLCLFIVVLLCFDTADYLNIFRLAHQRLT